MFRWRPYRVECTGSLSTSEVKRLRARIVLGWGTAWEVLRVLPAFYHWPCALLACIDSKWHCTEDYSSFRVTKATDNMSTLCGAVATRQSILVKLKTAFLHFYTTSFATSKKQNDKSSFVSLKGLLRRQVCKDDETSRRPEQAQNHLPREKLMWQANLQLEAYQLSHW